VDVVELGRLSDAQRAELRAGEEDPFGAAGNPLQWRPKDRHVALRRADGRLIASAGLVLGDLQVEDRSPMRFVGLGGVFVTAACRGRGLGKRIVGQALRRAGTMGPDVVLLFCHRNRTGFYEQHAFVEIESPVLVQQVDGYAEMPLAAMWRALSDDAALHPGQVAVHSLPF
jgi:predicted GNAT family N-acyltransferase